MGVQSKGGNIMTKTLLVLSGLALAAGAASAQQGPQGSYGPEVGRVLSSTPIVQQVAVPRQVCGQTPAYVQNPRTGAGAVIGAVAGGALGNSIGGGSGRAAATVLGVLGGAMLGDSVEAGPPRVENVPTCSTQTGYENRTVAYNVVYEYAGRQYSVQMPNDPGPTIALNVSPAGAPVADTGAYGNPQYVTAPYPAAQPAPVYYPAYPGYYRPAYAYPPVGVSLNLGYTRGHWR